MIRVLYQRHIPEGSLTKELNLPGQVPQILKGDTGLEVSPLCPHARPSDYSHKSQSLLSLSPSHSFSTRRTHRSPGPSGVGAAHTPAAAAAALHVPVIDGGGDIPVAEAPTFQRVLITAVEGDIAPWRHLLCGQNWACKPTQTPRGRQGPPTKCDLLRGASA